MSSVTISHGFPPDQRRAAAILCFGAFQRKIGWLLGGREKGVAFIGRVIDPRFAICALDDSGELAGLAGFRTAEGSMVGGGFSDLAAIYGWISACWRGAILSLLDREIEPGVLLMDGIAVTPDRRGGGIGTRLLDAIADHAGRGGYHSVRLDVIDTNPRARALYERRGFVATGVERLGPLRRLFGFSSSTRMVLDVRDREGPTGDDGAPAS